MSISAVVHTYNEEQHITACLRTLVFADEIVVVDNESTDRTRELAQAAGARVVTYPGAHGYPEPARAFGLTQLTGDWIFILDADERVTPELAQELQRLDRDPKARDGYWIPIKNFHFGRWLRHGGLYPDLHLRFCRQGRGGYPELGLHRGLQVQGEVGRLESDILHYSYRSLTHYFEKFNTYTSVEASRLVEQGKVPTGYTLLFKPLHRFCKSAIFRGGFLDGIPGLLFHIFSAAYVMVSELKAWETFRARGVKVRVLATLFQRQAGLPEKRT